MTRASSERHAANDSWGEYRLVHRVVQSQATEIWEVAHQRRNQTCAMKIMMPHWAGSRHVIQSLKREYNVGRTLDHHTVIQTYGYGVIDRIAFLVMEFYPAPNLKQWTHQKSPEEKDLARVIRSMAESLCYFHQQNWVHRDIKPDNFLVGDAGKVKLIDFNLAKKLPSWLRRVLPIQSKVQGTPSYMSPEQIRGEPQDFRSDIYSFGCVLFELLTGKPPFTGESANDLLNKHLRAAAPSPQKFNAAIRPAFSEQVQRLLSKRPDDRPRTMDQVLEYLSNQEIFTSVQT
ncbi:MAG: hypothetical protein CBB70_02590 [Planctomycetaceae bacterium TMED10]|nr:MAG: hypothetical protein CBB70_02590 [Planctomycetaceae bacterium TMED10]